MSNKCQWMTPPCIRDATIFVPSANMYICDEHYVLNILRMGCDLKGILVEKRSVPMTPDQQCQTCGWEGTEADFEAPFSDFEPGCPECGGTDFLEVEDER